jgi:hypothetical protein
MDDVFELSVNVDMFPVNKISLKAHYCLKSFLSLETSVKDKNLTLLSVVFFCGCKFMRRGSGEKNSTVQLLDAAGWSDFKILQEDDFFFPLFSNNHQTYLHNKMGLAGTA